MCLEIYKVPQLALKANAILSPSVNHLPTINISQLSKMCQAQCWVVWIDWMTR